MRISPQISSAAIIALGNFNPLIFRPDWFRDKEIVIGGDFEGVQVDIIHSEICSFRLPWGQMHVDRDRFSISATREPIIRAQDFFVKTFQSLPETPIRALGINRDVHFAAGSRAAFAPKDFWGDFLKKDGARCGGLRSLIIEQAQAEGNRFKRLDGLFGFVRVHVEPSIRGVPHGIYVLVNNHIDLLDGDRAVDGRRVAELASEKWTSSLEMSEALIDRIMELASAYRTVAK
jgi:hypothetical protein